jgi:biopolymer transport protein ExbD
MSKFRKDGKKETPAIATSALPDIVFMLLFFFMVTTTMRETTLNVKITLPQATEVTKLEKKSLVSYIYVGPPVPQYQAQFGTEPRIQLNDRFSDLNEIFDFVEAERLSREESQRQQITTSLKVDEFTKMKIVTEIKQELRKAAALRINYSARKGR